MISRNFKKTLGFAVSLSAVSSFIIGWMQINAGKKIQPCSYLDPLFIDVLALVMGAFLIIESLGNIIKHKDSALKSQLTRCMRMALGATIITIHIIQLMHK